MATAASKQHHRLMDQKGATHEQGKSGGDHGNCHGRLGGISSFCCLNDEPTLNWRLLRKDRQCPYFRERVERREPYLYKLEAVNAAGDRTEIEFGTSRELRQDAFLKLDLQPIRGVVGWSEVSEDALPPKAEEILH